MPAVLVSKAWRDVITVSNATLKVLDPTQVELEILIAPEEFERAYDAAFRKLAINARIPGFRKGKVPRKIFENTYGTRAITDRALEDLVPLKYADAVKEHAIEPLARPEMELLPVADGEPIRFKAIVPVRPSFEPADYSGLEVTDHAETATDEDLQRALETMRKEAAILVPVERPVKLGDVAVIDYAGSIDGVPFDGGTATQQQAEISEERFIPGFAAGIVGMSAGESKDVAAKFPDEYGQPELAGKDAVFAITVHDVKEPELPELDDDFAKRVSEHETLAALEADLRQRLDKLAREKARRENTNEILDALVSANDFPLPEVLVQRELDGLLEESRQYVARAGVAYDEYLVQSGKTEATLRDEFLPEAQRRVKTTLLIEEIGKREAIEATQADIDAELDALARQYQQPRQRILELLGSNAGAIIDGIVRTKTMDRIIERAKRVPATKSA